MMASMVAPMLGAVVVKLQNALWAERVVVRSFGRTGRQLEVPATVAVNPQKNSIVVPSGGSADIYCFNDPNKLSIDDFVPIKTKGEEQHGYAQISYKGQELSIRYMKPTIEINQDILVQYHHPRLTDKKSQKYHRVDGLPLLETEFREQKPYREDGAFAKAVKIRLNNIFADKEKWVVNEEKHGWRSEDLETILSDPWKLQMFVEELVRKKIANRLKTKGAESNFSDDKLLELVDVMIRAGQL